VIVYLSGGMANGDWQKYLINEMPQVRFLNPCEHKLIRPREYLVWDLAAVRQSDVVFAYLSVDNPSGIGMAVEIGYATALGKLVVFVDEKHDPRFNIVGACASYLCSTLHDGIIALSKLEMIYRNLKV